MPCRLATAIAACSVVALVAAACGDDSSHPASDPAASSSAPVDPCDWPMFGAGPARTFATECADTVTPQTAPRLEPAWFRGTHDVVTATPAVVDGTVYVGDWSGRFYALDLADGSIRWSFDAPIHPAVYSGQIVSSAAVADVAGERRVFFGAGRTLYALAADDGALRWTHDVHPDGDADDPSEIQSSPVVVDGLVLFGFDGHDEPGVRAGVRALDAASGDLRWDFDPDVGADPTGCVGVWASPAVDVERRLAFAATANCPTAPEGWGRYSEAIFALDLDTGTPRWSFQPHEPNHDDFDFAGAPNLFAAGGRDLVGLGNKDGTYYAVDRETGAEVWRADAAPARIAGPNYSTGGFIGATAVADGTVVGGTAIGGPCPCLHGIDAATGELHWQQDAAGPTYGAAAVADGVAFVGGTTDFTLRAVDLASGAVLWSQEMTGGVAGGVAIAGTTVVAVAGIREPGLDAPSKTAGVTAFVVGDDGGTSSTTAAADSLPPTTAAPPPTEPPAEPSEGPACIGAPCAMRFVLKEPPPGTHPSLTLHVAPDPFRLEVRGDGLGDPSAWLLAGSPAADVGAVTYGVFVSERDDDPSGTMVCQLDAELDCVTDVLPEPLAPSYNRVTVLAITDSTRLPGPAEGFARMVTTISFDPALRLG